MLEQLAEKAHFENAHARVQPRRAQMENKESGISAQDVAALRDGFSLLRDDVGQLRAQATEQQQMMANLSSQNFTALRDDVAQLRADASETRQQMANMRLMSANTWKQVAEMKMVSARPRLSSTSVPRPDLPLLVGSRFAPPSPPLVHGCAHEPSTRCCRRSASSPRLSDSITGALSLRGGLSIVSGNGDKGKRTRQGLLGWLGLIRGVGRVLVGLSARFLMGSLWLGFNDGCGWLRSCFTALTLAAVCLETLWAG